MNKDIGRIGWIDMTVDNAAEMRDFYSAVVGLVPEAVSMGDYDDYSMTMPGSGEAAAGICHARGGNADIPACWLIYFTVDDVDASAAACVEQGGELVIDPRGLAGGRFCVIRDPNGAVAALYQP